MDVPSGMRQGELLPPATMPDAIDIGFIAASCDPERGIKISMSHHCCSKRTPSPAGFVCSSIVPRYQPFQTSDSDVIGSFYGSGDRKSVV